MDRGKMDIEGLSEQRWSRVERDLFDRVARGEAEPQAADPRVASPPRWRAAAALVLAGAAAAVGGGVAWRALAPSSRVVAYGPSRISAGASGSHVTVGDSTVDVAPQTTAWVTGDDAHGVTVLLEKGRVECEVAPRQGRPRFAVEAGDVHVRVVGTHFAVTRAASEVDVQVQRGVVEVTSGERRVEVHAGETWPQRPPAAALPVLPSASSAPLGTMLPEEPAATPPGSSPAASIAAAAPTPRAAYESASRLEATRPDAAIAIYGDLAAHGGPWGMNALFAKGRLQADRGRRDEARRTLTDYLDRYPSGPNADDARQLLDRLR
jgi:hypothetical protein